MLAGWLLKIDLQDTQKIRKYQVFFSSPGPRGLLISTVKFKSTVLHSKETRWMGPFKDDSMAA